MGKRILFVSGEKGGTGKSTLCWAMIDHALRRGDVPFVVEGDASVPDVAARYRGHLEGLQVPLQRPDSAGQAVVELFSALEQVFAAVDCVVVNLPAGASATVDRMAEELIGPTLTALGVELSVLFLIGPGEESVQALAESWESGLCSIASRCVPVPNEFFGAADRFGWHRSTLRQEWLGAGHPEFTLPRLIPRVADRVRALPGPLHALAEGRGGELTVVERAGLAAWLRACAPLAEMALSDASPAEAA